MNEITQRLNKSIVKFIGTEKGKVVDAIYNSKYMKIGKLRLEKETEYNPGATKLSTNANFRYMTCVALYSAIFSLWKK